MAKRRELNTTVLVDKFRARFSDAILATTVERGEVSHLVKSGEILGILTHLKADGDFQMEFLSDVIGVDNYPEKPRFTIVYQLLSLTRRQRLRIKADFEEGEKVPSVTSLWKSAGCAEREVYDMFGIEFTGHPDLRRIYLPDDWEGYPLRKDYPLKGYKDKYNPYGEEKK